MPSIVKLLTILLGDASVAAAIRALLLALLGAGTLYLGGCTADVTGVHVDPVDVIITPRVKTLPPPVVNAPSEIELPPAKASGGS